MGWHNLFHLITLCNVVGLSALLSKIQPKVFLWNTVYEPCTVQHWAWQYFWEILFRLLYWILAVQHWAWQYFCEILYRLLAVQHWAWQASFPPLRNDYQGKKRRLSCALLPPYKLIISPSICFFSLRSHNGVTFSIFSRALLAICLCRAFALPRCNCFGLHCFGL